MPNHVKNIIHADKSVLKALINKSGEIDFNEVLPVHNATCEFTAQSHLWGTKWNAYEQDIEDNKLIFTTAWAHPDNVVKTLSLLFPKNLIKVQYADEDLGSNCGFYEIKGGHRIVNQRSIAWFDMTDEERREWRKFAAKVKYGMVDPSELGYTENWDHID